MGCVWFGPWLLIKIVSCNFILGLFFSLFRYIRFPRSILDFVFSLFSIGLLNFFFVGCWFPYRLWFFFFWSVLGCVLLLFVVSRLNVWLGSQSLTFVSLVRIILVSTAVGLCVIVFLGVPYKLIMCYGLAYRFLKAANK